MSLLVTAFLDHAREHAPDRQIVDYVDGVCVRRSTYREQDARIRRVAGALVALGVRPGDRVATLAGNHHRHLELYLAVPLAGAVLHTVNLRLDPAEIAYVVDHAEDSVLFLDAALRPAAAPARAARPGMRVVVLDGEPEPGELAYEDLVASGDPLEGPPPRDGDDLAALCYTTGTTGAPKGVGYSHRALYLHTMAAGLADGHALSRRDRVVHLVAMFHANAWGVPLAAFMVGADQVLPGPHPRIADVATIVERERATYLGMVPTLAVDLVEHVRRTGTDLSSLRALVLGGSTPSRELIRAITEDLGVPAFQGWGMTETSPMATFSAPEPDATPEERIEQVRTQGRLLPGLRWRLVDEDGAVVPHDGVSRGELWLRGPWVASSYYRGDRPEAFTDGWLHTGDVATIDPDGRLRVVDRVKDLIKSGGEWISSLALEAALLEAPGVADVAVVAVPHERWQERPVAVVVPAGEGLDPEAVLGALAGRVPRWWCPDRVEVVDALPRTSVGKVDKRALRGALRAGEQKEVL
ncbi:long-chain-fatty-acid--CoA ligase [Actinomycetospora straminea]|uniref:Fatty acid--CoA ligase n=1 Tax=Actinomycetospora straminea TaxID=663607 RepID=A0ABP9DZX9_9PSEU|nr:long-chain-fatty-acid--CoA ligase [Actinomycetospora straminea]MDD7930992.1 long-chain-fatty-acid--CoA ligase [Actinomycetospora straminea]